MRLNILIAALPLAVLGAILAAAASTARADDLPHRKPGLWETTTAGKTLRQCIDEATDQITRTMAAGACAKRTVTKTGDGYRIEVNCRMGSVSVEAKSILTGDFDSEVKVEGTSVMSGLPTPSGPVTHKTSVSSRRVGPCEAGQTPGDVILPDGKVLHMPPPGK